MITNLAVVRFVSAQDLKETYELTPFARDMIEHINNFGNVPSSGEKTT